MRKVSLNEFKDCIVDENNNIVAEKPRWFDRHKWKQGEMLVEAFNKKFNLEKELKNENRRTKETTCQTHDQEG
ncbi:MAG: hypothetical protein KIT33_15145 [Candidatus Kapabacteria bacterium]|nr:hypothetical protein [Ignavibacteriota bacterium]MCW5886305.1 hypothetical protein [Candidatus Kapabacteria bacterium]